MTVVYELWEMRSGNLMESFDSVSEALMVLAEAIKRHGPGYTDSLALVLGEGNHSKEMSSGPALGQWALNEAGYPQPDRS
jgi:hypothetical protein